MVLERLPHPALIKLCKGVLDFYVYHINGKEIVCAREWPRKPRITPGTRFHATTVGAQITIESYRTLSLHIKKILRTFFRPYSEHYLDFFRTSYQSKAIRDGILPPMPIDFRVKIVIGIPGYSLEILAKERFHFYLTYLQSNLFEHREKYNRIRRGIICPTYRYIRKIENHQDLHIFLLIGWNLNIPIAWDTDISIFNYQPTILNPQKPFFGPVNSTILYHAIKNAG